jgi:5-methylcytosine-specific restriction endonuclease McrA
MTNTCQCGCGGVPKGGQFLPGHDAKLKRQLKGTEEYQRQKIQHVQKLKARGCQDCGRDDDGAYLTFHHIKARRGQKGNKAKTISDLLENTNCTFEDFRREVERCELLCQACHRSRHGGFKFVD